MPPRNFGSYQTKIYYEGTALNKIPATTTNPTLLEQHAKKVLSSRAYSYVAGGAGEKSTMQANRLAFRQWKLVPRVNRPMDHQSISVNLFGQKYKTPIIVGPVGVQGLFHNDKETGVAQVCAELGIPYTLSTASSSSIEDVAAANQDGHRWFQLYWVHDEEILLSLLKRAKENGFTVLVVSLDTWTLAWRPTDLDHGYFPFYTGIGNEVGFTDPAFRAKYEKSGGNTEDIIGMAKAWVEELDDRPHTWEQLDFLRKNWEGPIVLKGIQHVDDALMALKTGCEGLIVSNHGGRQVDGAIGSLDALPEIVEAVGDRMTVMFDSGVRTGADAIKALCLGAKAVLVGRPVIYGLAIGGKEGAKSVLESLLADFWQGMGLAGMRTIADCNPGCMRRINYPGDAPNML